MRSSKPSRRRHLNHTCEVPGGNAKRRLPATAEGSTDTIHASSRVAWKHTPLRQQSHRTSTHSAAPSTAMIGAARGIRQPASYHLRRKRRTHVVINYKYNRATRAGSAPRCGTDIPQMVGCPSFSGNWVSPHRAPYTLPLCAQPEGSAVSRGRSAQTSNQASLYVCTMRAHTVHPRTPSRVTDL